MVMSYSRFTLLSVRGFVLRLVRANGWIRQARADWLPNRMGRQIVRFRVGVAGNALSVSPARDFRLG